MIVLTGLAALAMALIHVFGGSLRFLSVIPRSRWLSASGGISVAYVFLHLLPEIESHQTVVRESEHAIGNLFTNPVNLTALLGLSVFYGLERLVKTQRRKHSDAASDAIFWLHISSFAAYNLLFGYLLLHREDPSAPGLALYALAIGLHFLVNDYGLRKDHKAAYHNRGRWLLAGAVLVGWFLGTQLPIDAVAIALLFGFLAGGIILNVLKEELPEERESRFAAFFAGLVVYAVLLLLLE